MTKCPPEEDLLAFHLGTLPEVLVDAVGDHLEECSQCEETLSRFEKSDDLLLAALRKPVSDVYLKSTFSKEGSAKSDTSFVMTVPDLPGYEILGRLGRGGMGMVYKAVQQRLNRAVALKQLACRRERDMARARREAESLARLQHPNIVQIFEVIEHEGRVYLALELVEGGPLSARLDGKPQPAEASARLVETLARAIHYAHLRDIVHRDLKPSNVLLAKSEAHTDFSSAAWSGFFPKLTDFGIAKQLNLADADTREGDVIGTPGYMAPEQAGGETGQAGPATDVYSLGVLLYELLTGRMPLLGIHVLDTLQRVRNEEPIPPRRLQPRLPRDLNTICLKCLQKDPRQRYASAQELADDLQRFLDHKPIQARPTTTWERGRKWIRRHPAIAALTALLVLSVVLGFSLVAWQWRRAEEKADEAIKAGKLAQEREEREKEARLQVQRFVARNALSEGINLCENGETARGLLWMVRALEMAEAQGDKELDRAARGNLTAWKPYLVRHRADLEQGSWAWAVAFSPEGNILATGSYDEKVRLWDAQGKPRGEPLQHRYPVWRVVFSPDGKTLLTGSGPMDDSAGEGRLWDVASGRLLASWPHSGLVMTAAFSPDGRSCLTLAGEEAVVRSIPDGKPVGRAIKHSLPGNAAPSPTQLIGGFSPDGKLIVTAGPDGAVRFWDAATGEARGKSLQADAPVAAVAFSPDGKTLLTGCVDGNARMWDVATRQPRGPLLKNRGHIRAVAFSPDGKVAVTAGAVYKLNLRTQKKELDGGEVRLWRVSTGDSLGDPLLHPGPVWSLAFSPKGRRLLTGCEDGSARLFLVATGERMATTLARSAGNVTQVAFSPDGTHYLTADAGGGSPVYARLWQTFPEDHLPRLLFHNENVNSLKFAPDSRALLSAGNDRLAQLWDVAGGQPKGPSFVHDYPVKQAVFSADGRTLFTFCESGERAEAALWDVKAGRKRLALPPAKQLLCAAFCDRDRALLVGNNEGGILLHDTSSGKLIDASLHHGSLVNWLEFSRDERTLLTGGQGSAILWDWKARRQVRKLPLSPGDAATVCFYPDESGLLLVQNGFAQVWDRSGSSRKPTPLFHAEGGIRDLAFAPDSRSVLIRETENRVRLWDVSTGKRIGPAPGQTDIAHIAFSPDSRHLAVADKRGRIALWETPQPLQGTSERLRLWAETLTGMELDKEQMIHTLDPDEVQRRRARLDELGGLPPAD